ncbi:hypothetical protein VTH82DRAFT_659 [Thermothelomyces myriococcoides]
MDYVHKTAISIIRDGGKIENILEMLEDIDDACENLMPEMEAVKNTAKTCLERVRNLAEHFQYWYWVICCLKNNAIQSQSTVQVKVNENESEVQKAEQDKPKHSGKEQAAQEKIAKLEVQLKEAQ